MGTRLYLFGPRCLVRDALATLLGRHGWVVVAADGDVGVALTELRALRPDLLLADLRHGCTAVAELLTALQDEPGAPRCVLWLPEHDRDSSAVRCLPDALVHDWLAHDLDTATAIAALADVADGHRQRPPWRRPGRSAAPLLSVLERRVLRELALGHSVAAVARQLGVPARDITTSRNQAMARLGLTDMAMLARFALRQGWIDAGEPAAAAPAAPSLAGVSAGSPRAASRPR